MSKSFNARPTLEVDDRRVAKQHIEALLSWTPLAKPSVQIAFTPAPVVL